MGPDRGAGSYRGPASIAQAGFAFAMGYAPSLFPRAGNAMLRWEWGMVGELTIGEGH